MYSYILILIHTCIFLTFQTFFISMISLKQEHLLQDLQQQERNGYKATKNLIHNYELIIKNKCCVDKLYVI